MAALIAGSLFYLFLLANPALRSQIGAIRLNRSLAIANEVSSAVAFAGAGAEFSCDCTSELNSQNVSKMSVLVGVFTMASKVERRNLLRLAYSVQSATDADVTIRFVIGRPRNEEEKLTIALESLTHKDIIILDCEENMNHGKSFAYFFTVAAMGVRFDYVMKVDDDAYVRVANLAKSLDPLPRDDLYYGYVIPCENKDPYAWYMAGMGYLISWDLVQWVHDSPTVRNNTNGTEDKLVGDWLKSAGKAKNRVSKKPFFYDHPEFGGKCAHDLIPETILIHQVKTPARWQQVLKFFEHDRVEALAAPSAPIASMSSSI